MSMVNKPTNSQIARLTADWCRQAGETVTVEYTEGVFYAFGSEFACLRLFYYYNKITRNTRTDANRSLNLDTWYFRLETSYI